MASQTNPVGQGDPALATREAELEAQVAELQRTIVRRDRQFATSRRQWLRAAEAALAEIPGASNSFHPAHDLWLRVALAKAGPVEIVLSADGSEAVQLGASEAKHRDAQ